MAAIMAVNPKAELARAAEALSINVSAANSLADFVKTNLGPKGTLKMLVGGAGDLKLTKDGKVLLSEVAVKHPTASLICRAATAQDDVTGDGTTTLVMLIGELLRQAQANVLEGLHPRLLIDGYIASRDRAMVALDKMSTNYQKNYAKNRELFLQVAYTSLRTKLKADTAEQMSQIVTDAILCIRDEKQPIDLHMVEIMEMPHKLETDSKLIRGLVLDHGARHPDMPKQVKNAYILTCNVSLEYEKTEVNSSYYYSDPAEREKMVAAEREFILERCKKIIALKQQVCKGDKKDYGFVVINQKGVDPLSLDMLARENIMALRRAKRRNMERLVLACGGAAVNSVEELTPDILGFAGQVYEYTLGEDKFTFIEDCRNPKSCTILLKGPNKHTQQQLKDALRDGLRAVLNAYEDGRVVPGAGAAEIMMHDELMQLKEETQGKKQLGVQAFATALLCVPKVLAQNSGFDQQEVIVKLQQEYKSAKMPVGLDISTGEPCLPADLGIWDNYRVKRQILHSATSIATNLLLVDEIMRAGMTSLRREGT